MNLGGKFGGLRIYRFVITTLESLGTPEGLNAVI
jgi:hypothetical protein